jgi:L-asparaginase
LSLASFFGNIFMTEQIIVLGTGGTIAGTASSAHDNTGYTAAQISIASLLENVPGMQAALCGAQLLSEQVAQLDSKDMDFSTMRRLAQRCAHYLAQPQIKGIVITHGTDTLEETAYFLHRVIPSGLQTKPIVLTCAMRPATSSEADGPRNLSEAVRVAQDARSRGVLAVCAGDVHHAMAVQKVHTYALNAFSSGEAVLGEIGLLGRVGTDGVKWVQEPAIFIENEPLSLMNTAQGAIDSIVFDHRDSADGSADPLRPMSWPRVEIVMNHAQASGCIVRALMAADLPQDPLRGIVVAGTGNGTVSESLNAALNEARARGVEVMIASRCAWGGIHAGSPLSAVKARVALVLRLLAS